MAVSLALLAGIAQPGTAAPRKDLPTWARDEQSSSDRIVQRSGYDATLDGEYRSGRLGVLLPTYGREPLYQAFRALRLGRAALEKQEAETPQRTVEKESTDGMPAWLEQRGAIADLPPPPREPELHRRFPPGMFGSYLNCGDGAFRLAAGILKDLRANPKLPAAAVRDWAAAQDAVFAQCGDPAAGAAPAAMPAELPASAPLQLRQLRQYQIAAATFYAGNNAEALRRFDAIAADKRHPQHAWAGHAAMRALLRSVTTDGSFYARLREIRSSGGSREQRIAQFDAAVQENDRKGAQVHDQIAARVKVILADKTLAEVHEPARKLLAQAAVMIAPGRAYSELSAALGRFDQDFDRNGMLFRWAILGDRLFDGGSRGDLIDRLRTQHEFFDWIRTIQGCTDNPESPNFAGKCEQEGAHALAKWGAARSRPWLLAALITAPRLDARLEPLLAAARQATPADMDYLSLRYYAVRLLRGAGRRDEAIALIDEVLVGPNRTVTGAASRVASSATNLFRQERLALAKTDAEALTYVLREGPVRLGADGDELLNRRLSGADLMRLANHPAATTDLRSALLAAAWWRADLTGNSNAAEAAARALAGADPRLRDAAGAYLKTSDADERRFVLAQAGLRQRISPVAFVRLSGDLGRNEPAPDWWCSFASADFTGAARIQRVPAQLPELAADAAARDAEIAKLGGQGTAAEWLARVALKRAKANPADAEARRMLEAVDRADKLDCADTDGGAALAEARRTLALMPRTAPAITEAEVRARYEQIRRAFEGKTEYRVSHIMVRTEAQATDAMDKLRQGAAFESVARESSIDPSSASKGGDLGWSTSDGFHPAFGDALRTFSAPGMSQRPVRTPFGWHVIKVVEIRPARVIPYEQARPLIEEELRKARQK